MLSSFVCMHRSEKRCCAVLFDDAKPLNVIIRTRDERFVTTRAIAMEGRYAKSTHDGEEAYAETVPTERSTYDSDNEIGFHTGREAALSQREESYAAMPYTPPDKSSAWTTAAGAAILLCIFLVFSRLVPVT